MSSEGGPDTGYSWVIALCCAYIHFALFGLFRSWGMIYVSVLQTYGVTREEASWPFNLCATVFQVIGPTVSILTHYVSQRAACLLGCGIATVGVIGCYFAESVMWLTIFYGVIHGLGFGVVVTLIPVFINQYFVKHRASALGIAFSGGSVSSFVIPIAMEWLLENYLLKGSFLLLGGLVMNTMVASSLLRPSPWLGKTEKSLTRLVEDAQSKDAIVSTRDFIHEPERRIASSICLSVECTSHQELHDSVFAGNIQDVQTEESNAVDASQLDPSTAEESPPKRQDKLLSDEDDVLFGGLVTPCADGSNKVDREDPDERDFGLQEPLTNVTHVRPTSENRQVREKKTRFKIAFHRSVLEILQKPMFHMITFTLFIFILALQSFFVAIVDYAKDKGVPESEGVYLLSIFSITDLIGRSGLGWITDRNFVKRKNMVIINLLVIGVVNELYPLVNHLDGLLTVAAFHGISSGSCITLIFVLQAEYLGMKRLTLVVGMTSFINGVLTLMGPGLIGLFRDTIGSYDWMFHSLGFITFAFAFIWIAESWVTRSRTSFNQSSCDKTGCK